MQYDLLIAGKAEGPFDETEVVKAYEEGDIDETAQIRPETGGNWMPLGTVLTTSDNGLAIATASPNARRTTASGQPGALSAKSYLKQLRERSCYGVLRTTIDITAVLTLVGIVLWWLVPIASLVSHRRLWMMDPANSAFLSAILILVNTLLSALSVVVVIALRQAAFVLIDISDTLLHEHARSSGS